MAHPRRIEPSATYLVTRRCYQRTFRLRPSPQTNGVILYCLAFAAEKTGVLVHAACVMSNHHHLVVTDPRGLLPDFLREFHRLTAKALNASQGQWENLWAAEPCNVVRLITDADVADKIAYLAANPVAAGLVRQPDEWPGVIMWRPTRVRVRRPSAYFHDDGVCPAALTLTLSDPPARSDEPGWPRRIARALATKIEAAHRELRDAGRAFLGRDEVLGASFIRRAQSYEQKRGVVPTFAAKVWEVRARLRRIERMFRARYREALEKWRSGLRSVIFPFGTWGMRVAHGVAVEAAALPVS